MYLSIYYGKYSQHFKLKFQLLNWVPTFWYKVGTYLPQILSAKKTGKKKSIKKIILNNMYKSIIVVINTLVLPK